MTSVWGVVVLSMSKVCTSSTALFDNAGWWWHTTALVVLTALTGAHLVLVSVSEAVLVAVKMQYCFLLYATPH